MVGRLGFFIKMLGTNEKNTFPEVCLMVTHHGKIRKKKHLTLRIIGPSKLAVLRIKTPLLYRFVHPSIGGSLGSLGLKQIQAIVYFKIFFSFSGSTFCPLRRCQCRCRFFNIHFYIPIESKDSMGRVSLVYLPIHGCR